MERKPLGTSSINVSEACLGTMYFGTKVSAPNAHAVLDGFIDHGGNFIDTANNYSYWVGGNGEESETLLGKWTRDRRNRNDIVLATKVGAMPSDRTDPTSPLEGLKSETIIKSCEDSLRRLQTDYIDLFYIHADLKQYPLHERWEALYQLEKSGKIRCKGSSNYELDRLVASEKIGAEISESASTALQQKMSYLHPESVRPESNLRFVTKDIIDFIEANKISLLTYSVLLSGGYERGYEDLPAEYHSDENKNKFNHIIQSAKDQNITPSQWVLQWILEQSDQIIPLIAASSLTQLQTNLAVFR